MNATERRARCAAQHFGLWAIEPVWFARAVESVRAGTFEIVAPADEPGDLYTTGSDGVATIDIDGHIVKGESSYGGTSSVRTRQAIRKAASDDDVRAILLRVDSPGGTVAGTAELAADVRDAGRFKPVYAAIDDLGASAAYWVASQAQRVSANATAEVGSIGTVAIVDDTSGLYEAAGVKVHVISTGPYKGAFADGTEVTDEHLAYLRERVESLNAFFQSDVKAGRGFDAKGLAAVSDGRVWGAKEAKALGLIDAVEPLETTRAKLAAAGAKSRTPRRDRASRALRLAQVEGWQPDGPVPKNPIPPCGRSAIVTGGVDSSAGAV